MKKIKLIFLITNFCILSAMAEKADSCFYVQADLANRWIWRGMAYSETPVVQPSFGFTNNKLNISIWGSYPFERRSYSEIDFIIELQLTSRLKLGLVDYFGINDSIGARHKFFDTDRETTSHMIDAYFTYKPDENTPLSFLYSLWFWGADRNPTTKKQNYSSYFDGKYEKCYRQVKASVFAGITFWKGFYAQHAAVVNMGVGLSKPIMLGDFVSIPAKIEFVLNPETQNAYVNAIITLK